MGVLDVPVLLVTQVRRHNDFHCVLLWKDEANQSFPALQFEN